MTSDLCLLQKMTSSLYSGNLPSHRLPVDRVRPMTWMVWFLWSAKKRCAQSKCFGKTQIPFIYILLKICTIFYIYIYITIFIKIIEILCGKTQIFRGSISIRADDAQLVGEIYTL